MTPKTGPAVEILKDVDQDAVPRGEIQNDVVLDVDLREDLREDQAGWVQ